MFGYKNFAVPQYLEEHGRDQKVAFLVFIILVIIIGFVGAISLYWQILSATALISFWLLDIQECVTAVALVDLAELKQMQECIKSTNEKLEESNKKLDTIATILNNLRN